MTNPRKHLWAGDWEEESRARARPAAAPPPPPPPPPPPARAPRPGRWLATAAAAALLIALVAAVVDSPSRDQATPAASAPTTTIASLGVTVQPSPASGAVVAGVAGGGPAARAGVQSGDVIAAVDGTLVQDPSMLADAVRAARPGRRVALEVLRNGETRTAVIPLSGNATP